MANPTTAPLTATVKKNGALLQGRPVRFTTFDPTVAVCIPAEAISDANGQASTTVTRVGPPTVTDAPIPVRVSCDGLWFDVLVTVTVDGAPPTDSGGTTPPAGPPTTTIDAGTPSGGSFD